MRRVQLTGSDARSALTTLLHRIRLAHPSWGVWEAADLHWWWRFDRATMRAIARSGSTPTRNRRWR